MSFGNGFTLSTGTNIPQLALGTWLSKPKEVEATVRLVAQHSGIYLMR
jgi:hypothetical protein